MGHNMAVKIERTRAFLDGVMAIRDVKARAAIAIRIERLAAGNPGDVQSVGAGVSELRIHIGAGWRVYFKRVGDEVIVLLCVGSKGSQDADIRRAKRIAEEIGR
jgi:putative addiction module killer protein